MSTGNKYLTEQLLPLLQAFLASGVQQVVLSPGSRSTPLAILLGQLEDEHQLQLYVDVDERSAGFFALGLAKTTGKPVMLVCTSGTAAANYYPAICEARISNVPLVVLTTDRPPELQEVGAPQTLAQDYFYGQQVKAFYRLPLPTPTMSAKEVEYSVYMAQKGVFQAQSFPSGPVHFNLPLRKPLLPQISVEEVPAIKSIQFVEQATPSEAITQQLAQLLHGKKAIIVAGPSVRQQQDVAAIVDFAQRLQLPVIADALSNVRGQQGVINHGDWIFKNYANLPSSYQPEVVIRLGATPVSAALADWLEQAPTTVYIDANRSLQDHTLQTSIAVPFTASAVLPAIKTEPAPVGWAKKWQDLDQMINLSIQKQLANSEQLTEPLVAFQLSQLPVNASLFVSNSMPIREVDDYLAPKSPLTILANRGANGIDGINSTALAMATQQSPAYLYTGDLAFFHDLTGLMMSKRYHINLTVIVQNNNGGGIFSFLPQAAEKTQFEKVFGTPLDLNIAAIAALYDAAYQKIQTIDELQTALKTTVRELRIIEIPTQRSTLVSTEQAIARQITAQIASLNHED